jgi:glycosyltransferase involved in cell wall biosynthesis
MLHNANSLKTIHVPQINSLSEDIYRPIWSVMIPTYNAKTEYLEQTIRSVLDQDPGLDFMQVEIVDDCSPDQSIELLVKDIGQGRISFFRQTQNQGLVNNWNTCIQRAKGLWIHILHQDDLVLPGFYKRLEEATETDKALSIGAAFCRHLFIDEDGLWQWMSPIEQRTSGILNNWIEKIAVFQQLQFPAMVVKRSVYEQLGGFCPEIHYAADWEMWKRIAAYYSVWYEPNVKACYRVHSASETSRLLRSGLDIVDIRKAIKLSEAYLPPKKAKELSCQSRKVSALYALNTAQKMLICNDFQAAIAQIKEALNCSYSIKVIWTILFLFPLLAKRWLIVQLAW